MRLPKRGSLSSPPLDCRIRLSTLAAFSGYWVCSQLGKDRLHLVGQPEQHVAGVAGAGVRRGRQDVLEFVIV